MELKEKPVCNIPPNLGELVELSLVFPEFLDPEPIELVKPHSVICVEKVECSLPSKFSEDGIEKSMSTKRDTLLLLPLLPQC